MDSSALARRALKGGDKVKGKLKEKLASDPVKAKRKEIIQHIQQPKIEGDNFVTIASLREVWKWDGLKDFIENVGLGFEVTKKQLNFIENHLLRTLSILVYIKLDRKKWQKFPEIFMKDGEEFNEERLDDKLPYDAEVLTKKDFLGSSAGSDFYANQNIFIPIVLKQGEIIKHNKGRRLPLKTGGKLLGSGAFGKVTKEVIPEGHLVFAGEGEVSNTKDLEVARKVILVKKDFNTEVRNLERLREGLRQHKRIVTNIAAVIVGSELNLQFNLFFKLAKTDLGTYLYGLKDPAELKNPVDLKTLIAEASNLVDALHFLHGDLSSERGDGGATQNVCYHADLKPDNILVYERPDDPNDIVGEWKIADFGISRIEALPDSQSTAPNPNATIVVEQRAQGIYTAPETEAGRLSDIWSFGCIFHQILAAGIGGGPLVSRLDEERRKITDDGSSFKSPCFYNIEKGGRVVLKSCAKRWVENDLAKSSRCPEPEVMQGCSKLIIEMLQIDKRKRPNAGNVRTWLDCILEGRAMPALTPTDSKPSGNLVGGGTASTPVEGATASTPAEGGSASTPVGGASTSTPSVSAPVEGGSASAPVGGASTSTPIASTPAEGGSAPAPTEGASTSTPSAPTAAEGVSASVPTEGASTSTPGAPAPAEGVSASAPTEGASTSTPSAPAPVEGVSASVPTEGASTSTPVEGASASTPVEGGSASTPVGRATASTPVEGGNTSTSVGGPSTSTPVEGANTSTPVRGASTSTPVGSASISTPAGQASTPTPVGGPTTSTPTEGTSASTPVKGATASEPPRASNASNPAGEKAAPEPSKKPVASESAGGPTASQSVRKPSGSGNVRGTGGAPGATAPAPSLPLSADLISTIKSTNPVRVYDLMKKGDKILAKDTDGQCALHHAAIVGGKRVLIQLLKSKELKGGNSKAIDQRDNTGATPLHHAASGAKREIVAEFINAGADKDAKDHLGRTPLHYAAVTANQEIGYELISAGADRNAQDDSKRTPLHAASLFSSPKHTAFVEFLLDHGAIETPNLPREFFEKKNYIQYSKRKRR